MIRKIRLMLEYRTYCLWLYNENDEFVDNDNPPEWRDNEELTSAFMAVSDLYDTFFINDGKEFRYIGCPDDETRQRLLSLIAKAVETLTRMNNGRYIIQNDIVAGF